MNSAAEPMIRGVIHHRAAANADREDIEDGEHANHPPLVIAPDIAQVFTHRGTARRRFDTLFGGKEAEGQHQEGNHRQHRDAPTEAERFVFAADKVDQRHHQHGGEHAPRRRQHEARDCSEMRCVGLSVITPPSAQ